MIFRVRDNPLWQLDQIRLHLCHAEWKYYTEIVHSQKSSIPIAASRTDPVSAYSTGLCEVKRAAMSPCLGPLRNQPGIGPGILRSQHSASVVAVANQAIFRCFNRCTYLAGRISMMDETAQSHRRLARLNGRNGRCDVPALPPNHRPSDLSDFVFFYWKASRRHKMFPMPPSSSPSLSPFFNFPLKLLRRATTWASPRMKSTSANSRSNGGSLPPPRSKAK